MLHGEKPAAFFFSLFTFPNLWLLRGGGAQIDSWNCSHTRSVFTTIIPSEAAATETTKPFIHILSQEFSQGEGRFWAWGWGLGVKENPINKEVKKNVFSLFFDVLQK
jgi:hypothetical protein